jgi:isopentenyl diphosphate isomerase/L-lactate dehydrogenase-like FMN-dependent dehydrogenase
MIDCTELSEESWAIMEALRNAGCAQIVYDALDEVPTENLNDMRRMINAILTDRLIE